MSIIEPSDRISRNKASSLLGVSTRTVDRYVDKGKLSSCFVDGRKWLSNKEVSALIQSRKPESDNVRRTVSTVYRRNDVEAPRKNGNDLVFSGQKVVDSLDALSRKMSTLLEEFCNSESKVSLQKQISALEKELENSIQSTEFFHETKNFMEELHSKNLDIQKLSKALRSTEKKIKNEQSKTKISILIGIIITIASYILGYLSSSSWNFN